MVVLIVVAFVVVGGLIGYGIELAWQLIHRLIWPPPTQRERAEQSLRRACRQVDDVFFETRVRMEEAVGKRQPGERRFGDDLRGSWREW